MRRIIVLAVLAVSLGFFSNVANAQATAQQTLTLTVQTIQSINVSAGALALTITTVDPGDNTQYLPVTDNATDYSIIQNVGTQRITAELDANMPANLTLEVALASTRGTSAGTVDISNSQGAAQDVVTAIAIGADANQTITYTFSGAVAAGTFSGTRVVTFTLTNP